MRKTNLEKFDNSLKFELNFVLASEKFSAEIRLNLDEFFGVEEDLKMTQVILDQFPAD